MNNEDEHIYVRLECAATLARCDEEDGYNFIDRIIKSQYLENRLEAIIILGEILSSASRIRLANVLKDESQHAEIRSGAAWALGELGYKESIQDLVQSFNAISQDIRYEAARALRILADKYSSDLVNILDASDEELRPGIAWALTKASRWKFSQVHDVLKDTTSTDLKHWITYMFGMSEKSEEVVAEIEKYKTSNPDVYFATTLLWKLVSSWIYTLRACKNINNAKRALGPI